MKDARVAEIAWLCAIALLIAAGAAPLLGFLAANRVAGTLLAVLGIAASAVAIRRAYVPDSPTVRVDVTKAVAYCVAAVLALVTVDGGPHWAIRACITAAEAAVVFDIITIAARPRAAGER